MFSKLPQAFSFFCLLCVLDSPALAQNFDKATFMRQGLQAVTQTLDQKRNEFGLVTSASCPAAGSQVIENLAAENGKVFSAIDSIDDVMDAVKTHIPAKMADNTKCGSCVQWNLVSRYASASPRDYDVTTSCESRPPKTFSMIAESKEDLKEKLEDILTGRSSEGRDLQRACPDPCSYYTTTAQTDLGGDRKHLALTVQCGPPRVDSIFSAVYEFKAGLIHQWSCKAP